MLLLCVCVCVYTNDHDCSCTEHEVVQRFSKGIDCYVGIEHIYRSMIDLVIIGSLLDF